MPRIVVFDEGASPQKVLRVTGTSENQGFWDDSGRTDFLVDPDLTAVSGVPQRYWKVVGSSVVPFTAGEQSAQDASEAAIKDSGIRTGAKGFFDSQESLNLALRAFADIVKDEINILRALHSLPDRTLTQLKNAIKNRIDSGSVDE